MQRHENLFKGLFIAATVFFLLIIIGALLAVGLTGSYEELPSDDRIALVVVGFAMLFLIALFTLIGVLVYKDAKKMGMNAWMWLLVAIYAPNGIGIVVYLIFRYNEKNKKRCPDCNYVLTGDYEVCPSCGHTLTGKCNNCGKTIEADWKVCPYCRSTIE